ncbi:MAG: hypothetical protein ABH890_04405 [Bacillota bacterium]
MTTLDIILLIALIAVLALYITSKFGKDKDLNEVIKEVKSDLIKTTINVAELVSKAKNIVFDESVQKAIKEFILIVEEKNKLARVKGEAFLSGDDKKKAVVSRLSEWVGNVTGSVENAVNFVETNQSRIDSAIEDYISFSNKMEGKATLSEAEKIIQKQLNKK